MAMIERRLSGRQASLAGITRVINRYCRDRGLTRIEVVYSTHAHSPLDVVALKKEVAALFRQRGVLGVELSVRHAAILMDDALGEHVVRIHTAAPAAAPAVRALPPGLRWLARWLPADRVASSASAQPAAPPTVSPRKAVKALRDAIALSARHVVGAGKDSGPIGAVQIVCHDAPLDRALAALVRPEAGNAAAWFADALRGCGVGSVATLQVSYRFVPTVIDEGTDLVLANDLEVRLVPADRVQPRARGTASPVARVDEECTAPPLDEAGTLLPDADDRSFRGLLVRVLGTAAERFDTPFELRFDALPARLDRSALDAAGFSAAHPALARLASRSVALTIDVGDDRVLRLHAPRRGNGDGPAMFFRADDRVPVIGTVRCVEPVVRLLVNSPVGVVDPHTGRRQAPMLIEILNPAIVDEVDGGLRSAA